MKRFGLKHFQKIGIYICLATIVSNTILQLTVMAKVDIDFYASNDILFYNPDSCSAETTTAGADTVTAPDKKYGTGPATAGTGHNWKPAVATSFGGASEDQPTSFGQNTVAMDNAGIFYYAILPKDYGGLSMNPNTPKEIQAAVKANKLKPKGKLIFKKGDKYAIGAWLDVGPGATGDGRWLDLGQKLDKYLGVGGLGKLEWDFLGGSDSAVTATKSTSTTASSSVSSTKKETMKKIFQLLINGGLTAVQAASVMGNMEAESGYDNGQQEAGAKSGRGGFGLIQWTGPRRVNLEEFAKKKGVPASDLAMQIEFFFKEYEPYKDKLGKSDFGKTDVAKATEAFMAIFERPAKATAHLPRRVKSALEAYDLFKDLAPGSPAATGSSDCSSTGAGDGVVAGNIVQTALGLALKTPVADGKKLASDANPAYITALDKYNPGANPADCGIFVGTVMIASGADKNYPKGGTVDQIAYVRQHPEKYKIMESPKSAADLLPGDILVFHNGNEGHTMIYTGETPYPIVDASLDQRVPSVRSSGSLSWMLGNSGVVAARLIK